MSWGIGQLVKENELWINHSIIASGNDSTGKISIDDCIKFSVMVVPDVSHTYTVDLEWRNYGKDVVVVENLFASAAQANQLSAKMDNKTVCCDIKITNGDVGSAHTYTVYLYKHYN